MNATPINTTAYLDGRTEFSALADELSASGASAAADAARELSTLFPRADLMAYNSMQVQPACAWKGFMFSKLRAIRDPKNPRVRQLVGTVVTSVVELEETARLA